MRKLILVLGIAWAIAWGSQSESIIWDSLVVTPSRML